MTSKDMILLEKATLSIKAFAPVKVRSKALSNFHRLISTLLFFTKGYMEHYWTTIGYVISYPERARWHTVFHEGVHAVQAKRYTRVLFGLLYLFPQVLSTLALLAFVFSWWWLLALLFLLPIPAPFRMLFELEAYCLTVKIQQWRLGPSSSMTNFIDRILKQFTGPSYWFMWPFKNMIRRKLKAAQDEAFYMTGNNDYELEVYAMLDTNGLTHMNATIDLRYGRTQTP